MDKLDKKLSECEAASILGLHRVTLAWRRKQEAKGGRPCVPPYIIDQGRVRYLESEVLKAKAEMLRAKAEGLRPRKWPLISPKRPAGCVTQRQAIVLLNTSKGFLDYDYRNGQTIPVRGSYKLFYPVAGIRASLAGKPDRLLTIAQTVKALDTTHQRLTDHVHNVRAGYYTSLQLPFEEMPSGDVGFRLSAVLTAAEALCAKAEE